MATNDGTSSQVWTNQLLLKPEEASFYDLVRFLLSPKASDTSKFLENSEAEAFGGFWRRWYIFNSLLLQKLLIMYGTPMTQFGYMLVLWLNFLSSNGGPLMLVVNLLTGKVVWPESTSATYKSAVDCLDERVELDKSIGQGNKEYNKALSVMASKIAYENEAFIQAIVEDHWNGIMFLSRFSQMQFVKYYNCWNDYQERYSTQAIIFQNTKDNPNLIVVAFKGTDPFDPVAWQADFDLSWVEFAGVGKLHSGFCKALGMQNKYNGFPKEIEQGSDQRQFAYYAIRERLREMLQKNENAKFIVTGHSLGGALAVLFLTVLAIHEEEWLMDKLEGVYTFGQPRVGDEQLGVYMTDKLTKYDVRYLRHVYSNDIVPRAPYDDDYIFFKHFGPCLFYNFLYLGRVESEEPNKNYFSVFWVIPKYITAYLEVIRSFIIPYIRGPDYKENLLMKIYRVVVGLVIPGVTAHSTQDYVNVTRLGSLTTSKTTQSNSSKSS
ncbi:putative feruloyl esterase A [Morella rubra]|uniref:Putative feruloyl esterase A n=1 Tax=Morella rubra TaxID=262757 RepID=A0A6A1WBQ4_9ROSI|nr:putative feruloyl esterase A [Morella rubra]